MGPGNGNARTLPVRLSATRTVCSMSARPDNLSTDAVLPSLATTDASAAPHIVAAAARTGRDIELRIHTSLTRFDVAAEQWFPAAAGFVVTVIVHIVDAATGEPRYLPPAEPAVWARAIFLHRRRRARLLPRRRRPEHRHPPARAAHLPPLPRHRPAADTRTAAAGHLPALPPTWPRRQSRDHHSHHGLTPRPNT